MNLTATKLTKLVIANVPALDPIHVYAEDIEPSRGSLLVRFDRAWYAYWGAMGTQKDGTPTTVRQFVLACDAGYIASNLVRGNRCRITSTNQQDYEERYVERIAEAIKQAFAAQHPSATPAPTLEDDSFVDKAIANASIALWENASGGVTNAMQLLVRPDDMRSDESGAHPGESFVMVTITREEFRELLQDLEDDWADHIKFATELPA